MKETIKKRGRPRKDPIFVKADLCLETGMVSNFQSVSIDQVGATSEPAVNVVPVKAKYYAGRPTSYTEDMPLKILKYAKEKKQKGEIATFAGACLYLGIHKDTLYSWDKDPEKKAFSDALHTLRLEQEDLILTGALTGKFKERSSIFILKSVHGYVEKEEKKEEEESQLSVSEVQALLKTFKE